VGRWFEEASIMASDRSVTVLAHDIHRWKSIWSMLCRAALESVEWAAAASGTKDAGDRIERAELLVEHGPSLLEWAGAPAVDAASPIDWARLGELERARVARVTGAGHPRIRWR
jgi:hypothetical protein